LLARGVARQREFGIRLAIGASRRRVISQLLTEGLLLALASAAVAFGISRLALRSFVYALTSTFPPDIGNLRLVVPAADWRVVLFLLCGATVTTLVFALAPALRATRMELVRAIRGELVRNVRPSRARDALVVLQVTGSVLLLICAGVFLRSSWEAAAVDPGIRTAGVLSVRILNNQTREAVLRAVRSEPLVESVAASWPGALGGLATFSARVEGRRGSSPVQVRLVSPEYFGVFAIDLVRGRSFTTAERGPEASVAIVSESLARRLWPGSDAVGQPVHVEPDLSVGPSEGSIPLREQDGELTRPRIAVVVGVARDVAGFRMGGARLGQADVYMPIASDVPASSLTMRMRGESERARHALVSRLAAIDPNAAEVSTPQTIARAEAYLLGIPFWLTLVLGTLALLLTLSGLFSVVSYLVQQRTKEIGVRIALGSTRRGIAALVLLQSARPVGTGLLLGGTLTGAFGALLLSTSSAELIGSSVRLFDPLAYAAGLLWIAAACAGAALIPVLRATRIDPIGALRQE
jgi:predicted permease